jgi:hypothetical protein
MEAKDELAGEPPIERGVSCVGDILRAGRAWIGMGVGVARGGDAGLAKREKTSVRIAEKRGNAAEKCLYRNYPHILVSIRSPRRGQDAHLFLQRTFDSQMSDIITEIIPKGHEHTL